MKRTAIALLGITLLMSACTSGGWDPTGSAGATTTTLGTAVTQPPIQAQLTSYSLQPFDACDDFLDYVKEHAVDLVGPWGFSYDGGWLAVDGRLMVEETTADTDTAAATAPSVAGGDTKGVDFSGTNVQELGVDEPDIVKTDGSLVVAVANNTLYTIDVSGDTARLAGSFDLGDGWAQDILLADNKVLVMATSSGYGVRGGGGYPASTVSVLTEIDVSDPAHMEKVRTLTLDGSYVSARMIDGVARIVVSSAPTGLAWVYPEASGLKAERDAEQANRELVLNSTIENWVPYYVMENGSGTVIDEGPLLDCSQASHPQEFSGINMLTVLTVDLDEGLRTGNSVGVLADGNIVYASDTSLYVATTRWMDWTVLEESGDADAAREGTTTEIHKFDISDPNRTVYAASGSVQGFMLSQWSMSEYDGFLRVATTDSPDWWWDDIDSESYVKVLEDRDGELAEVGSVGGIGNGERIYSVRFMGDVGYVVTFRQTDPLYTIDLSDPTDPVVAGELELLGYSAYLHPVGDGLLLGVGQDATDEGRTTGTQISLFDVSDPANPQRLQQYTLEHGSSEVEWDHHAFLYWEPTEMAVVPVQTWWWDEETETEGGFAGAVAVHVDRDGIEELAKITHDETGKPGAEDPAIGEPIVPEYDMWRLPIRRSLVIGDRLFTVSDGGILQSDLDTLEDEAWVSFGVR
jgi:uncharacterized secreted protein with C-terminal beta-propeller domain